MSSDERFKEAGQFEPKMAWRRIKSADFERESEAKHPMKLRHYAVVFGGAVAIIAIPLIVISFFL